MVLGGARNKAKPNPCSSAQQAKGASKKAGITSATSENLLTGKDKRRIIKQMKPAILPGAQSTDSEDEDLLDTSQAAVQSAAVPSELLQQFERMLNKALKRTSDQITSNLTKEIRDLGSRTETLESKVEEIEIITQDCQSEIDTLKEENLTLQNKLEDYENRARRSNLRFRGIPESIIDLPGTPLAICQELLQRNCNRAVGI